MNERRIAEVLSVDATLLERSGATLTIHVGPGSYQVEGKSLTSSVDLESFLRTRGPASIRVLSLPGASYRDVAVVIKAIQDSGGAGIGLVGNKAPD